MKGISIAIETVVYLIIAVTVLSVLLFFFLSQAGPAQDQFTLEAKRDRFCGIYTSMDFGCNGKDGKGTEVVGVAQADLLNSIGSTCSEIEKRFGFSYGCAPSATLECIQKCCHTCPQKK